VAPIIAIVVAVVSVGFVVVLVRSKPAQNDTAKTSLLAHPAPDVQGTTIDGKAFDLASMRGSWVVLNFFATWCQPCQAEQDDLARFALAQGGTGARLVSIVNNDTDSAVRSFLQDHGGATWPVVRDPDGRIAVSFGVAKVPETWLIDPNGFVAARIITTVTSDGLANLITQLGDRQTSS
jgi:cytochrome c biogenesis protein CcmG/thiol:disulfide interchange protein DsbE